MSEVTARALEEARAAEAEQRAIVGRLRRECVETVATGLPGRLDAYAKKIAQEQPDVTKGLGVDKLAAMRKELANAADHLAAELRSSVDQIPWNERELDTRPTAVHSALFKFIYGSRVDRLTAILTGYGFYFHPTSGILPQDLYDQHSFGEVAEANVKLVQAETLTAHAKTADDRDAVESMWDESSE